MENNRRCTGWVSWVCHPHFKPYFGSIISDTKEKAESAFCGPDGKRHPMFADCKIVHQEITIDMPPEVVAEYDKWLKHIGQ